MKNTLVALVLGASVSTAFAAPAATPAEKEKSAPRFRFVINVLAAPQSVDFSGTQGISLYAESGTVNTRYQAKSTPVADVYLQFNFSRHVGMILGGAAVDRDETANVDARLPHPLYLDRPRTLTTSASGLQFNQTVSYLGLAVGGDSGKLEYALFAGPGYYEVEADLASGIEVQEEYPYDTVTGTVTTTRSKKGAVGFRVGGRLDAWLTKAFGLGAQAGYGSAKIDLGSSGNTTPVTAGGFEVGGGLRFRF